METWRMYTNVSPRCSALSSTLRKVCRFTSPRSLFATPNSGFDDEDQGTFTKRDQGAFTRAARLSTKSLDDCVNQDIASLWCAIRAAASSCRHMTLARPLPCNRDRYGRSVERDKQYTSIASSSVALGIGRSNAPRASHAVIEHARTSATCTG